MVRALMMALALVLALPAAAQDAEDRRAGYYYPEIGSSEEYTRVIRRGAGASKDVRVGFVTSITASQLSAPANPRFVIFAKGSDARHLIIVALDDDVFSSLFRARAMMAQLTSNMRNNEFFVQQGLESVATFYDFLQLLEFDSLVISDGKDWAHRVDLVRE